LKNALTNLTIKTKETLKLLQTLNVKATKRFFVLSAPNKNFG
jgi:hypothetical protein